MLEKYYKKKKEQMIEEIIELAVNPNLENKHLKLREKLNSYSLFCYKHGIEDYSPKLFNDSVLDASYIIDSEPLLINVEEEELNKALEHLKEVLELNKDGLIEGITLEEAEIILNADIELARKNLIKELETKNKEITTYNLMGSCGFMQALTLLPLQELGVEITINNVTDFSNKVGRHAFGTVSFPIKEKGKEIQVKSYLIDATYRQFFPTFLCTEARYYNSDLRYKDQVGPEAGYYVCLTEDGKSFARTLLKKGFIEWTPKNAKIYGNGFICASQVNLKNLKKYHEIKNISEEFYFNSVYQSLEEIDYSKEELEKYGFEIDLEAPTLYR